MPPDRWEERDSGYRDGLEFALRYDPAICLRAAELLRKQGFEELARQALARGQKK